MKEYKGQIHQGPLIAAISILALLVGCCTSNPPSILRSGGVKYQLLERVYIDREIEKSEMRLKVVDGLVSTLKMKFPDNSELLTYLGEISEKRREPTLGQIKYLRDVREDVVRGRGELYSYRIVKGRARFDNGQPGLSVEEGWVVLVKGKVYKKYIFATGIEDESLVGMWRELYH